MGLLIFFFVLSIAFSFLCSILEAVILSVTPSYVNRKVQEGATTGELLKSYQQDIDKPLSAILTLNTIAHTVGAIGVGAQAGKLFGDSEIGLGFTSISMESIIAAVMTLAILILSEIIPKTIGANNWRTLAPFTVQALRIMILLLTPFVWLSQAITKGLKKEKGRSVLSRADLTAMAQASEESGAIDKDESKIIKNLLRLNKLRVRDVMTPRAVMVMAEISQTLSEYYEQYKPMRFSRIPVFEESQDRVVGMVLKDEVLRGLAEDQHQLTLTKLRRDIKSVLDTEILPTLFDQLLTQREHIAIVHDEYGTVVGLVTLEDVLETILGLEIMDESDTVEDMQRHARQQWEKRAKEQGLAT
ncbi:hemolysin family protein [Tunicatimonas pelagia]|uniref:hemolysin family protein n=1 Tax=Tunicatimonas pelagia TaxID=931531 RepID=UPI0026653529|nr:hemolysin family protein [Tunicatimonas pelagia]WKN43399.1 hemolysin family protein [Tunicatimonas pelagia]